MRGNEHTMIKINIINHLTETERQKSTCIMQNDLDRDEKCKSFFTIVTLVQSHFRDKQS